MEGCPLSGVSLYSIFLVKYFQLLIFIQISSDFYLPAFYFLYLRKYY